MLKWFRRKPKPKPERGSDEDKKLVRDSLKNGRCPDCGSTEFYEGPSGGACTNFECAGCGSRFNLCGAFGTLMIADRI